MKKPTGGGMFAIGTCVDEWGCIFENRQNGNSKVSFIKTASRIASCAIKTRLKGHKIYSFKEEKSNGIDAQIRWKDAKNAFSLGVYYTRFSNFIGLFETGNLIGELPEAQFRAVPAVFKGLEFEGKVGLTDQLTLNLRGDYVHAKEKDSNEYLPRIAPLRLGAGLQYQLNKFSAKLDVLRAFKQDKTANNELATDGYTNVSALVAYKLPTKLNLELFAKANNLLNDEIREHASFLKDISLAGERSLLIGLRGDF
jgi:iron complex outermembrane receptor protein